MVRMIEKGDPGTDYPVMIDGITLSILPSELDAPPEPISQYLLRLDGGASEHQRRTFFVGSGNYSDRYTWSFPLDQIKGADRIAMEEIRVRGGPHRIVVWRMVPVIWACALGLSRYYLPRFRRSAAQLYDGTGMSGPAGFVTITTETFPIDATLNEDVLTVTYAEGPTLADPGAGVVVVSRQPDASGEAKGYTAVRVGGTIVAGDELKLWGVWAHDAHLQTAGVTMRGQTESHAYVFVEV